MFKENTKWFSGSGGDPIMFKEPFDSAQGPKCLRQIRNDFPGVDVSLVFKENMLKKEGVAHLDVPHRPFRPFWGHVFSLFSGKIQLYSFLSSVLSSLGNWK
jgi:hypothetical protein